MRVEVPLGLDTHSWLLYLTLHSIILTYEYHRKVAVPLSELFRLSPDITQLWVSDEGYAVKYRGNTSDRSHFKDVHSRLFSVLCYDETRWNFGSVCF